MEMAMGVVIALLTGIAVWLVMIPTTRMIRVSPTDFQRLLAREQQAIVFWKMGSAWGEYLYISSADGLQVYTKSKQKLEFPESCELIMMQY